MGRRSLFASCLLVAFACCAGVASAAAYDAYEAHLDSMLHARDRVAESLFVAATAARESSNFLLAEDRYTQVIRRLPDFWPAHRRLADTEFRLGNRRTALERMRWLVERDSSAYTLGALTEELASTGSDVPPSTAELEEARFQLRRALRRAPDDPEVASAAYWLAWADADTALMRRSIGTLVARAPDAWSTWCAVAGYDLRLGQSKRAREALARSARLGAPATARAPLEAWLAALDKAQRRVTWARLALLAVVAWFLVFALLMFSGAWLSRSTLAAAGRALEDPTGRAVGLDAWLRRAYAAVIAWSCVFFYLSIPLVLLVVIALGGGLLYGMLAIGHLPLKLLAIVAVLTLVTLWSVVRGLFARGDRGDPGPELDLALQPRLRDCLQAVATRIGTRTVDRVFITPGTDIAVFERGGIAQRLRGKGERCLILGLGVLDGMTVGQWQAILAHEYGHFVNRDTAGGGMALVVRRSLVTMAVRMALSGAAGWFNPAWWFVRGFHAAFMRVSQGASRLQEILADRWAASAYGAAAFVDGLTHVISASVRFEAATNNAINRAMKEHTPLANLYRQPSEPEPAADKEFEAKVAATSEARIVATIEAALAHEPDPLDSHPSPRQRFAWVQRVDTAAVPAPADERAVWELLDERAQLEATMTAAVLAGIEAMHGVKFVRPGAEPAPDAAPTADPS